jgi:hypothetical protein
MLMVGQPAARCTEPGSLVPLEMKVKVNLSLSLINEALRHDDVWGSGYIDPRFVDLDTSWR